MKLLGNILWFLCGGIIGGHGSLQDVYGVSQLLEFLLAYNASNLHP